jgi:hypothetical protein
MEKNYDRPKGCTTITLIYCLGQSKGHMERKIPMKDCGVLIPTTQHNIWLLHMTCTLQATTLAKKQRLNLFLLSWGR